MILIIQESNALLDECHKSNLPGIIGWNLIKLACQMFVAKNGLLSLENLNCPMSISPLLFSQVYAFHHSKAGGIQSDSVKLNTIGQQQVTKRGPTIYHQ